MADRLRELMTLADSLDVYIASGDDPSGVGPALHRLTKSASAAVAEATNSSQAVIAVSGEAETLQFDAISGEAGDRNLTLPLDHRGPGDSGPTLPFQLGD